MFTLIFIDILLFGEIDTDIIDDYWLASPFSPYYVKLFLHQKGTIQVQSFDEFDQKGVATLLLPSYAVCGIDQFK
jgi:hypothetical protein